MATTLNKLQTNKGSWLLGTITYNSVKRIKRKVSPEDTQISMDRWVDKQNVVCTYNGGLQRKEILTHAIPWMNFDDIMLRKISQ